MADPRRSDARRNRAAILRAATEAFGRDVEVLSAAQIGRLAGVGQATVYRHFPDRRALTVAVMGEHLKALTVLSRRDQDPAAFRHLLGRVLRAQAAMRPLVRLLRQLPLREQQRFVDQVVAVMTGPFGRAREAGLLHPDLRPGDLAVLFEMIEAVVESVPRRPGREETIDRVIGIVLDGLFVPAPDG